MTVVSRSAINGSPVLMADLLLSHDWDPKLVPEIPTVWTGIKPPKDFGKAPIGLRQKMAVLNDDLILGWSGSGITAQKVIHEISRKHDIETFTEDTLQRYLEDLPGRLGQDPNQINLSLLGFLRTPTGVYGITFRGNQFIHAKYAASA